MTPKVAVLLAPGINCHEESAFALELAGADPQIVLDTDILEGRKHLRNFASLYIPGGFSYGDHFGAGRVAAIRLGPAIREFAALERPILGVCNGFQILMEAGLFSGPEGQSGGALVQNQKGVFESRSVTLITVTGTVWTKQLEQGQALRMPVAHGEGRWYPPDLCPEHLHVTFRYSWEEQGTEHYPENPNGSPKGLAGLAYDLVMGMMPHPERAVVPEQGSTDGLLVLRAFVKLSKS